LFVKARKYFPPFFKRWWRTDTAVLIVGLVLAVIIRIPLLNFKSLDYYASLQPWYNTIKHQGFSAFATNFSTYNPPYLYFLYVIARYFPDTPSVIAVKIPSLFADFLLAYFVYRIVQIKYPDGSISLIAGLITLFAPTIILNSAFWGQADSLFTAGLVASLFFLMTRRNALAVLAYGIALTFKLQAIFLAPVIFALCWRGIISWKHLIITPLVLILALIPTWIAGRPISDLLNIYLFQTSQFELLTMNAPSIYAWLPATKMVFNQFYIPGVIAGMIAGFVIFTIISKSIRDISRPVMVELVLLSLLVIPFFLPKMHDRYFYPADVVSIIFAFYFPKFYYVPILINGVSFFAYQPFLFNNEPIPMPVLASILLLVISILFRHTLVWLYSPTVNDDGIHVLSCLKHEANEDL